MTILVDDLMDYSDLARQRKLPGTLWCHMVQDTPDPSFAELHEMADRIGLRREWFQGDHYDLTPSRRSAAVLAGAQEVGRKDMVQRAYWGKKTKAQAVKSTVTLAVHTAQYRYSGPSRFDVTRGGFEKALRDGRTFPGGPFAPPRWLLDVAKGYPGAIARLPRGVPRPPTDSAGGWAWYDTWYTASMRRSYRANRPEWDALLARPEATLVCFCADPRACHRTLLAAILVKLGARYLGERDLDPERD